MLTACQRLGLPFTLLGQTDIPPPPCLLSVGRPIHTEAHHGNQGGAGKFQKGRSLSRPWFLETGDCRGCDVARYSYTAAVLALGFVDLKVSRKSLISEQQSASVLLSSCCWSGCFEAGGRGGLLWP